ncbi:hypothetical protein BJI67_01645 [Acidihalobacter aeolianus]|uniref:Uncharacterized protein n=1 Tax=Acidihalobacter aeolianus TaxID=2792603 RepID=A0A1D8K4Q9_9GAMM|nr:hypothetical protein [Acidihalobacter aeolianus]AOV15948.1 hypothetical protein BJI67_01645 [Acidihalobacter aeolianus]
MISQEQVMQVPTGNPDSSVVRAVRRARNIWLALFAVTILLSAAFVMTSVQGLRQAPTASVNATNKAAAQPGWADHTQYLNARENLLTTGMLLKWSMADLALVLGIAEISAALTLYLRALTRGAAVPMSGKRVVPNILRRADREYLHEALPTETATGYVVLSALALGSAIMTGFLMFDNATWVLAAIFSGNW